SVNIHASVATVTPAASRAPFVLHLPPNVITTVLTHGGAITAPVGQGYKLQADRKTCLGKSRNQVCSKNN
ncbi:hypothetical protein OS493_029350, partial [Desmophyllum pertusum]